jgi:hypothetical protein
MGQDATLTPFKLHALYVIATALMNPAYSWSHLGSMWSDAWEVPSATEKEEVGSKSTVDTATAAAPYAPGFKPRLCRSVERGGGFRGLDQFEAFLQHFAFVSLGSHRTYFTFLEVPPHFESARVISCL